MVEERGTSLGDGNGFINARAMGVAGLKSVTAVVLQQDIFSVVDVAAGLAVRHFLNSSPQPIVPIRARERRRGIAGHEVFHLGQPVFCVIGVLAVIPRRQRRLAGQIPVVIVLVAVRGIRRELVSGVDHTPASGPVPHGIVGEGLRRGQ